MGADQSCSLLGPVAFEAGLAMYARNAAKEDSGSPPETPLEPSAVASCWTVAKNSGLGEAVERTSYIRFRWERVAGANEGIESPPLATDGGAEAATAMAVVPCPVPICRLSCCRREFSECRCRWRR